MRQSREKSRPSLWALAALAVLPVVGVGALFLNRDLFEPFFQLRNIDPAYAYLMNSMTMLCGHTPRHIDHPGTTLQILGSVVIGAMNLLRGASPVCPADDVFTQPEIYLAGIGAVLQVAIGVMLFALPARIYVLTGNLIAGLAIQASFLTSATIVSQLIRVQPEVLLMPVVLGFGLALLPLAIQTRRELPRDAIVSGAILGFGLATKITILPLFLFVFMFDTFKAKLRFVLTCFGAFRAVHDTRAEHEQALFRLDHQCRRPFRTLWRRRDRPAAAGRHGCDRIQSDRLA